MIKIYGYRLSPFVERIYQMVQAKGIEDKFEFLPIPDDGLKGEEFLSLNPIGKMPVMVDGDFVMPESALICEYIEAKFPEKPMFPADMKENIAAKMITRMMDAYIFHNMFESSAIAGGEQPDKEIIAEKLAQISAGLDVLESFITNDDGKFLVGDSFSIADCAMGSADFFFERILKGFSVDAYANRPKLKAWHDENVASPRLEETYATMDKELVAFLKQIKENQ